MGVSLGRRESGWAHHTNAGSLYFVKYNEQLWIMRASSKPYVGPQGASDYETVLGAEEPLQPAPGVPRRRKRFCLDFIINVERAPASLCNPHSASSFPASFRYHHRFAKTSVHGFRQHPRTHVRHAEPLGGFIEGANFCHCLEQFHLARAQRNILSANDSETRSQSLSQFSACHTAKIGKRPSGGQTKAVDYG